jgi:demethylmenaquinone methyltransferase/2-methoxy-6-polyprenyl-1,4-benzoquinol methylase
MGVHRVWKRYAIEAAALREGEQALDVAGGTGDLTAKIASKVGKSGHVTLTDINAAMIGVGRDRLLDRGLVTNISYVQSNAECLPFADNSFDCITIAFGLRNVTDKQAALNSMQRVLRPGGRLLILEFSHVQSTMPIRSNYYPGSARWSPTIATVINTWWNRFANTRIRKP